MPTKTIRQPHYGRPGNTVAPELQARIIEMCRNGVARNEIHRQTGVGRDAISGICKRAGLNFDRTRTRVATAARTADLRARRAELSAILLEDAMRLRGQIWEQHEYIDHGGKNFDEARWTQPEPSPADKLKLMQAAAAALGRHLNLEMHDTDTGGVSDVKSMLGALGRELGIGVE